MSNSNHSFPLPFPLSRQMLHLGKPQDPSGSPVPHRDGDRLGASLSLWEKTGAGLTALPPLYPSYPAPLPLPLINEVLVVPRNNTIVEIFFYKH
jgi:hypothetical protein